LGVGESRGNPIEEGREVHASKDDPAARGGFLVFPRRWRFNAADICHWKRKGKTFRGRSWRSRTRNFSGGVRVQDAGGLFSEKSILQNAGKRGGG